MNTLRIIALLLGLTGVAHMQASQAQDSKTERSDKQMTERVLGNCSLVAQITASSLRHNITGDDITDAQDHAFAGDLETASASAPSGTLGAPKGTVKALLGLVKEMRRLEKERARALAQEARDAAYDESIKASGFMACTIL